MSPKPVIAGVVGLLLVACVLSSSAESEDDAPVPVKPTPTPPCPGPGPCPKKPRPKPWGADVCTRSSAPIGKIALGGKTAPDGKTEVQVDLPNDQKIKNIGSHKDGAGMCVMSSIEMAARWQLLEQCRGLRDWCAQFPGGGYPEKVDKQLAEYCTQKKIPCPSYVQYEGADPAILEEALKSGRLPAVTYSGSDGVRYSGPIAHMVTLCHLDKHNACVLDNNWSGDPENQLLWMSPDEFLKRWGSKSGWAFVWLAAPPPPVPHN